MTSSSSSRPRLRVDYYVRNFETVLFEVSSKYHDILSATEQAFIDKFRMLPENAKRLYVRLLTRVGPWLREKALFYAEIEDIPEAIAALQRNGFAASFEAASIEELVAMLKKDEIVALLEGVAALNSERKCYKKWSKEELSIYLLANVGLSNLEESIVKLLCPIGARGREYIRVIFFLFFGNFEQDLTDFVVSDVGNVRYEKYQIDTEHRLFSSRREVDFLITLQDCQESLQLALDESNLEAIKTLASELLRMEVHPGVRLERRFCRTLGSVAAALERLKSFELALECFEKVKIPPARERMVRIFQKQGIHEKALDILSKMYLDPFDISEEHFAQKTLMRLAKTDRDAKALLQQKRVDSCVEVFTLKLQKSRTLSVEELVLEHFLAKGEKGFFAENSLWQLLFALAFWDVIFASVPTVFQHPFQSGPLDLSAPDFYLRRESLFNNKLTFLKQHNNLLQYFLDIYDAKFEISCVWAPWGAMSRDMLLLFLTHVPHSLFLNILEMIMRSPRRLLKGFPDLFVCNRNGDAEFLEVKGPGDRVRPEQAFWLRELNSRGLIARVVYVSFATPA